MLIYSVGLFATLITGAVLPVILVTRAGLKMGENMSNETLNFPENFLWGGAIAANQAEGLES